MAKKFMYVCFGVLALMMAFLLGAKLGTAMTIVDHTTSGIVAWGEASFGVQNVVLLDNGEVWRRHGEGWVRYPENDPPVAVSQIKFWTMYSLITTSNERWWLDAGTWENLGAPPGGVAIEPTTWGNIKAKWRDSDG